MLNIYEYEGKTEEETLNLALKDLNELEENLIISKETTEGNLFKSKKCKLSIIKKNDINLYIKEYLKKLSELLGLDIKVELRVESDIYNIQLISNNNSILIGKDGRTITAMQTLLRQSIEKKIHQNIKINIDVANYKNKKIKRFESEIKKIAKEILNSKIDVSLDPMNSYERRIVHNIINNYENLETESIGEGKERHVVIKYIGE